jgi:hypothetical protein
MKRAVLACIIAASSVISIHAQSILGVVVDVGGEVIPVTNGERGAPLSPGDALTEETVLQADDWNAYVVLHVNDERDPRVGREAMINYIAIQDGGVRLSQQGFDPISADTAELYRQAIGGQALRDSGTSSIEVAGTPAEGAMALIPGQQERFFGDTVRSGLTLVFDTVPAIVDRQNVRVYAIRPGAPVVSLSYSLYHETEADRPYTEVAGGQLTGNRDDGWTLELDDDIIIASDGERYLFTLTAEREGGDSERYWLAIEMVDDFIAEMLWDSSADDDLTAAQRNFRYASLLRANDMYHEADRFLNEGAGW